MATLSAAKRRLRLLLVSGLVLIPGAVLSVVTWRLIGQERELESSRLAERRELVAARIAQQMLSRLELERAGAMVSQVGGAGPESGIFLLVAPVTERGLALPWEAPPPPSGEAGSWAQRVSEGEALEFGRGRPDLAVASYAAAADAAPSTAVRIGARLREARALSRSGRSEAALAAFAAVAAAPPELQDREGMPLALYGAEGLLSAEAPNVERVLDALERIEAGRGLGPPALYGVRDLARRVMALAPAGTDGDEHENSYDATRMLERVRGIEESSTARIRVAERLLELRRDLPAVLALAGSAGADSLAGVTSVSGPDGPSGDSTRSAPLASAWRPYGSGPWLVGVADGADGRLVLVADPARLMRTIAIEGPEDLGPILPEVTLTTVPRANAELLGPSFPALFAVLPDAVFPDADGSGFGRVLLVVVLPLVLAVTILAAFLLWRDVRREIETAGLRSQFVSSVSHELKTPLTSIRMYAQTLLLGRYRAEAERQNYLETIVNESERLTRLINNVLDFSRIERGGRSYRMEPVALGAVVRDAARAMSYPLDQGGFDLRVRISDGLPPVHADADALTQAVLNLLSNAVKFSGNARVIGLELARRDGDALIRVRDHGHGIEQRYQNAVFERFFRTPAAQAEGVPGTGLGLALVAHVVSAHGGRVELESEPGRGSTFTIRLPLDRQSPGPGGRAGKDGATSLYDRDANLSDRGTSPEGDGSA